MSKHTPGPWKTERIGAYDNWQVTNPAGDAEIGTWMVADHVRFAANARLIAAAPDLLRELENMILWAGGSTSTMLAEAREQARAAIAKAKGEVYPKEGVQALGQRP